MADHAEHAHGGHGDEPHACPMWILIAVAVTLLTLTALTLTLSNYNFGRLDLAIAMVIATIKATLVMTYFMHLRWDRPFNAVIFLSSFIFAAIFFGFSLLDTSQNQADIAQRTYDEQAMKK